MEICDGGKSLGPAVITILKVPEGVHWVTLVDDPEQTNNADTDHQKQDEAKKCFVPAIDSEPEEE